MPFANRWEGGSVTVARRDRTSVLISNAGSAHCCSLSKSILIRLYNSSGFVGSGMIHGSGGLTGECDGEGLVGEIDNGGVSQDNRGGEVDAAGLARFTSS